VKVKYIGNGSSGNSTLVVDGKDSILIDNGLPLKRVPEVNAGILISHKHSDHILGVERYFRKYGIRAIVDKGFYIEDRVKTDLQFENFREIFYIKSFKVQAFDVWHDEPCFGFIINDRYIHLTDTGHIPFTLVNHIENNPIELLYVESNYDEDLIDASNYGPDLKARIKGKMGHLSTQHVLSFLAKNEDTLKKVKTIIVGHLSERTNNEELLQSRIDAMESEELRAKIIIGKENTEINL